MENSGNNLIYFDNAQFTSVQSKRSVLNPNPRYDYGIILKIHPQQFRDRTWFVCAGLDEWGTSGAAWYLAKKWKELYKFAKNSPFAVIVKGKYSLNRVIASVSEAISEIATSLSLLAMTM